MSSNMLCQTALCQVTLCQVADAYVKLVLCKAACSCKQIFPNSQNIQH